MIRKIILSSILFTLLPTLGFTASNTPSPGDFCGITSFFTADCVSALILSLLVIIMSIVGSFVTFVAGVVNTLIQISGGILGANIVSQGFAISLGLANLGFVLMIIVIAFATILRVERYELKKTLRNLIIAAILVNFSLTIAGIVIDFNNVLGNFFISKATSTTDFGTAMASALNVQGFINISGNSASGGSLLGWGEKVASAIMSLLLGVIFSIIIVIVFGGIAIMLLVRYIFLTVLLIVMPLAWLFWIIPDLSKYWSKWWETFLKWNFFLPAVMFFLYLAILGSTEVNSIKAIDPASIAGNAFVMQSGGIVIFLQALVKIGLFVGALLAGNALGIAGSGGALAMAKKVGSSPLTAGKSFGKGFLGPGFNKRLEEGAKNLGKKAAERTAQLTSKVPLLRGAASALSTPIAKETQKIRGRQAADITRGGESVFGAVQKGERTIKEVKQAAKRTFRNSVLPGARKERAQNIMALAKMEKDGKYEAEVTLAGGEKRTIQEDVEVSKAMKRFGGMAAGAAVGGAVAGPLGAVGGAALGFVKGPSLGRNARMKSKIEKLTSKGKKVEGEEKEHKIEEQFKKMAATMGFDIKEKGEGGEKKGGGKKEGGHEEPHKEESGEKGGGEHH